MLHILSVCICSLMYSACNTHAPYCHLWPAPLYSIFPHSLINGTIFERKVTDHNMYVLIFSTSLSATFLIFGRNERDRIKISIGLHVKYPLFLSDFNESRIFRQIFVKYSNIKFHENPSSVSRVPCGRMDGQTDRYDEANGHFSQFCERA